MKLVNMLKEKKEWLILAAMAAVIFFFGTYRLWDVGQPILYEDEFGYWSNSSFFLGQDWSATTSSISYYSYGYSLLLIPIRLLANLLVWNWRQMYEAAIVMQSIMLVMSFLIAVKLCKRYLADFHWLVRDFACLTVLLYPTYIVYAHITWTETTLAFLYWCFLYLLMRVTDKPTIQNHIGFALLSFYMYVVHQRCLAVVIAAILIVFCMRLLKENTLMQTAAVLGTMFLCNCIHTMIKGKLQNDFYLAQEPAGLQQVVGCLLNKKTLLLLIVIVVCLIGFWLIERGKGKIVLTLGVLGLAGGVIYVVKNIDAMQNAANTVEGRIAVNDFAGQLRKLRDIFSLQGFLRLLISIAGKWFYLASASGLVICFGIWELGKRFVKKSWRGITTVLRVLVKNDEQSEALLKKQFKEDFWFWGAFLGWLGIFGVCSIYILGLDRIDNLVYGRYHEIAAGFLILFGFYYMIKDKKWIRHMAAFLVIYFPVAWLCQDLLDELGLTHFELGHSVMFGKILMNGATTEQRIWQMAGCAASIGVLLGILIKTAQNRFPKAAPYRMIVGLIAVIVLWTNMGTSIVESYVISVNHRQEVSLPTITTWINRLSQGENIYFLKDTKYYRWGLALQYNLYNKTVIFEESENMNPTEDAFYVVSSAFGQNEEVLRDYAVIVQTRQFTLLVPKDGKIHNRMEEYGY